MRIDDLDYSLPPGSIADRPAEPRDHSRLMVVRRAADSPASGAAATAIEHRHFFDIGDYLRRGDLLVVNETRVLPAKLLLRRRTGAAISGLFLAELQAGLWEVLLRTRGKVRPGETLLAEPYQMIVDDRLGEGRWRVHLQPAAPAAQVLAQIGHVPLPPYIEAQRHHAGRAREQPEDRHWYQTVYARSPAREAAPGPGSVAAPTAGLHFTPALLQALELRGVRRASVDLEVGLGTFLPVETDTLEAHRMHRERYVVPAQAVADLRAARAAGSRIVVVGTTAVRTLETAADKILDFSIPPAEIRGETDLKIAPGYHFRLTDALITNFHLPRSTLMALVGAFLCRPIDSPENAVERLKNFYLLAIQEHYRFYSYGDAMLILP